MDVFEEWNEHRSESDKKWMSVRILEGFFSPSCAGAGPCSGIRDEQ